jgi:excisionase family DNA binding protein
MVAAFLTADQAESLGVLAERLAVRGFDEDSRAVREILGQIEIPGGEVSTTTAARILDVTPRTIRGWVRRGTLPGRRDGAGRFRVSLQELRPTVALRDLMPSRVGESGLVSDREIAEEIRRVRGARRTTRRGM